MRELKRESNSIYEWKRYFNNYYKHNSKVSITLFICKTTTALYYTTTKLVLKAAAILYNNNQQPYIQTKLHNLTQIDTHNNIIQTTNKPNNNKKKTDYTNIAGDRTETTER